nr:AGE family epimerase/isomerase [Alsobacter ponti]
MPAHRLWLLRQADALFDLFAGAVDPAGGFHDLDTDGSPMPAGANPARQLHATTRMVHCFAIGHLMGRPGCDAIVDHGMAFLWNGHRDAARGGYLWGVGPQGPTDDSKQAYGHAFVLLAASSAKVAGHPDADRLLADVTETLLTRFWEERHGAVAEEFARDWTPLGDYRGQNSNMHLTEALMAAFEATGDGQYLRMAERIADLIVNRHARALGWRLAEHFDAEWALDRDYSGSPMFRPYGVTPGHWLEWARLLVQLWELGGRRVDWLPGAARGLFLQAVQDGWDRDKGGFYYTLEWSGAPRIRDRYWWPCCEGIGAAHVLRATTGEAVFEEWYRRIWNFSAARFIDAKHGGWVPQLDDALRPNSDPFFGKPDIYHALQACLIPLLPATGSITRGLVTRGVSIES